MLVILTIAFIIWIEDKGPIFYHSERIGKKGAIFKMHKLRSMKINAPDIRLEDGSTWNSKEDPRVTRIGKFIRQTSIDELPQLFNVVTKELVKKSFEYPAPSGGVFWQIFYKDMVCKVAQSIYKCLR